jgi:hypothetical protein
VDQAKPLTTSRPTLPAQASMSTLPPSGVAFTLRHVIVVQPDKKTSNTDIFKKVEILPI